VLDPALITALATLITSIAGLVAVLRVQQTATRTHETLKTVDENTNGNMTALKAELAIASDTQATSAELAARDSKTTP
jgi:uncharacterized membrane protein